MTHKIPTKEYSRSTAFTLYDAETAIIDRLVQETGQNRSEALRQIIREWESWESKLDALESRLDIIENAEVFGRPPYWPLKEVDDERP